METVRLADRVAYHPEKLAKIPLFDSPHLFYDLYALEPGQAQKVHAHAGSDKVYQVLEGTASVTIGDEVREIGPGWAVRAPAGIDHGVANRSDGRLLLLVVMAPKPQG